jgi:hypothetical protein
MTIIFDWPGLASPADNNVDMPILDKTKITYTGNSVKNGVKLFDYSFAASTAQGNMELFTSHQLFRGAYPMKRVALGLNVPNIRTDSEKGYDESDPQFSQIQIVATIPATYWMTPAVFKKMLLNGVGLTFGTITSGDPATDYLLRLMSGQPMFGI